MRSEQTGDGAWQRRSPSLHRLSDCRCGIASRTVQPAGEGYRPCSPQSSGAATAGNGRAGRVTSSTGRELRRREERWVCKPAFLDDACYDVSHASACSYDRSDSAYQTLGKWKTRRRGSRGSREGSREGPRGPSGSSGERGGEEGREGVEHKGMEICWSDLIGRYGT
jgi:hypothetical protein